MARSHPRPFYGWYVVAVAFCVALFGWGFGFYGLAVYLPELTSLRGWSAGFIGTVATAYYLCGAIWLAYFDAAVRRFGQRTVLLGGVMAMAAGVSGLPLAMEPWQLVAAYLLMSMGWAAMSLTAVTAMIAPWFVRARGLAMSLALNGASCGGIVLAPAMMWLSSLYGFGAAIAACVAAMIVVLVPLVAVVVRRPEDLGLSPDGDGRYPHHTAPDSRSAAAAPAGRLQVLLSLRYWTIAAPFALGLLAQVGFITHQVAFLEPHLGAAGAGLALGLTTMAAVAGRVGLGMVVDRLEPRLTTAACLMSQAVALLVMTRIDAAGALYAMSILFGLSVGNLITLPALIVQRESPPRDFVVTVALIAATSQGFYAFGPGVIGIVRDVTGGYGWSLGLCIALELTGALILLSGRLGFNSRQPPSTPPARPG